MKIVLINNVEINENKLVSKILLANKIIIPTFAVMEIKIESNIPIAPKKKAKGAALIYPFDKMNVNDSFEIPEGKKQSVTVAAYQYAKRQKEKGNIIKFEVSGNRLHRTK